MDFKQESLNHCSIFPMILEVFGLSTIYLRDAREGIAKLLSPKKESSEKRSSPRKGVQARQHLHHLRVQNDEDGRGSERRWKGWGKGKVAFNVGMVYTTVRKRLIVLKYFECSLIGALGHTRGFDHAVMT